LKFKGEGKEQKQAEPKEGGLHYDGDHALGEQQQSRVVEIEVAESADEKEHAGPDERLVALEGDAAGLHADVAQFGFEPQPIGGSQPYVAGQQIANNLQDYQEILGARIGTFTDHGRVRMPACGGRSVKCRSL